jgi:hypothetical protein
METKIGQISELSNLLLDKDSLNHNLIRLLNQRNDRAQAIGSAGYESFLHFAKYHFAN